VAIEDTEEYKRIYSKYANKSAVARGNIEAQAGYSTYKQLAANSEMPGLEDADPNETPAAVVTEAPARIASEKLDKYRICRRCQGLGQYKEYLEMGHGCTREVMKSCEADIDGSPCDGGIVPKNWKPGQPDPRHNDDEPVRKKGASGESSGGKFEGKSEPCSETLREMDSIEKSRAQRAEQAVMGEEPLHQITMLPATENEDAWLEAKVELPLVASAGEIEAEIEHMRFLIVQVPGMYYLRTELPEYVDDEDMECTFDTSTHSLKVSVPVVSTNE